MDKLALRPLLDFAPRNLEFHNFSSLKLTAPQSKALGLGLKFRPTLKPPSVAQFLPQIQDFCRSVRLHKKFEHQPDDPDFNPRLYVKSEWDPPREDPHLEDNLYHIRQKLCQNLSSSKPKWNANLNSNIRAELKNLKENKAVRVTDTDKNLGPAVVSADWMKTETLKHLNDPASYDSVTQEEWSHRRCKVIENRERLMNTYKRFLPPNTVKFLRSFDNTPSSTKPAKFYVIPKIHKTPMASRPIAASHSYITRPISIYVDEIVKPNISMPTVLRDSKELIQILESIKITPDCLLVTADVKSLYPNINIKKAIIALDLLLRENRVPETPLLIQLARIVFENNFLTSEFSNDIFHQTFGIAMGTPFAVTAANAFMLRHEKNIVNQYSQYLQLYKRFIDDIVVVWTGPRDLLLEFINALNTKDDRIKITFDISDSSIPFLDLLLFKDREKNTIQFCTFQKPLNKYLYIPFESFHPASNKRAFIKGELMRYARNSSNFTTFADTRELFWKRLRLRGYPYHFLLPLFREVKYSNRNKWLKNSKRALDGKVVVFKTTYNCSHLHIKGVIQKYLPELKCIISYKSTKTYAFIYIHIRSYSFIHFHIHSFTTIYIHVPSYTFIYIHMGSYTPLHLHMHPYTII